MISMEDITCNECIDGQLDSNFTYLTPKILDTYKKFLQDKIQEALYNKTNKLNIHLRDAISIICKFDNDNIILSLWLIKIIMKYL